MSYIYDRRDLYFTLFDVLKAENLFERFEDCDRETVEVMLGEAQKLAEGPFAACDEIGDQTGCTLHKDGRVETPPGFKKCHQAFAEGGWLGLTMSPDFGGMGMPEAVGVAATEMFMGANVAFTLSAILTRGAAHLIESFGNDEQKAAFVEKMFSGEWAGTMCLTETQAGSDLGALTTLATPRDDGSYAIKGSKTFITYGDHDLTENIIHLVLARLPDAPKGPKGISLLIVPKLRDSGSGDYNVNNDVECVQLEHKMGINGSATCQLAFGDNDHCVGYLVGKPHHGLAYMFLMMNMARIEVGIQGMSQANCAYQMALAYAKERVQGRPMGAARDSGEKATIIAHPDVRRMLADMKAFAEGLRSFCLTAAMWQDIAHHAKDDDERARYSALLEVSTPIVKAYCTDTAFRVTEWAVQVFGGYGYCRDQRIEQRLRDVKIASLYEGTNGIQANDLMFRKLLGPGTERVDLFLDQVRSEVKAALPIKSLTACAERVEAALDQVDTAIAYFRKVGAVKALAGPALQAVAFLEMLGDVSLGGQWLAQARVAQAELDSNPERSDGDFYRDKIGTCAHFTGNILPRVSARWQATKNEEAAALSLAF